MHSKALRFGTAVFFQFLWPCAAFAAQADATVSGMPYAIDPALVTAPSDIAIPSLYALIVLLLFVIVTVLIINNQQRKSIHTECRRFSALLGSSFESVSELDLTHHIWSEFYILNSTMKKTKMPETLEVYIEHYIHEHIYREDAALIAAELNYANLLALAQHNSGKSVSCRMYTPKGDVYWCSFLLQGSSKTRTDPAMVMLYIRNIDDVKKTAVMANERMADALRNAEKLSRVKDDFMSRISHEIRTPLNAIMGFLAIARQNTADEEKLAYCMGKADEASHHMLALVDDVLTISAIEKKDLTLNNQPFQLRAFINNLGSIVFELARQKGLEFTVRMESVTEEYLIGDQVRLHQVLQHLISNAIKFTDKGGHVSLLVRQTALKDDATYLSFTITDDGIGLKDGYGERIFNLFEQEEKVSSRVYGGTGLGLPLVKNMVETMGGSISVQSKAGEGSQFIVSLPFGINRYVIPDEHKRRAYAKLNVLIVDDHQASLEYVTMLFHKLDIAHSTAISGDVALQKAQAAIDAGRPFDLYFVDWVMPGMSGHETIQRLLANVDPQAKVVVLTGYDQAVIAQEASDLPIASFIIKPLFQSTLVDLLGDLLGKQAFTADEAPAPSVDWHGKHALLAEDNELNREIAIELLAGTGLAVDAVANGQEAFERLIDSRQGFYQLVLMDIQMPVMDGYDAARAIRASAHPDAATLPIIAMTANAFPEDISRSLAAGMNDHLSKPIDIAVLRQTLDQYLKR